MTNAIGRSAVPTRPVVQKPLQTDTHEIETAGAELETNSWQTTPLKEQKLTRANILNMQRTIGNQAVMRMIKSNKSPKVPPPSGNTPKPIVQRKIGDKKVLKALTSYKSSFNKVYEAYNDYDNASTSTEFSFLLKLEEVTYSWVIQHSGEEGTNEKRRVLSKKLLEEIKAEFPKILGKQIIPLSVRTGLPDSYLEELLQDTTKNPLMHIAKANAYLEMGDVSKADKVLVTLKDILPSTYPLIKSALLQHNLGAINPEMAKMLRNEEYRQNDEKSTLKGNDVYTQGRFGSEDNTKTFLSGYTATSILGSKQQKEEFENEKGFSQMDAIKGLSNIDISSINQYTQKNFKDINTSLRNMPLTGPIKTDGPAADQGFTDEQRDKNRKTYKKQFTDMKMNYTQNTISALNKIPPYIGKVYRHDKLFAGFKEVYREGAVVSDMAFVSTTYKPESLNSQFGEDIVSIITSKTGRFIKPISSVRGENEVLFKPGTRFMIKKVYEADLNGTDLDGRWPDLNPELRKVLEADSVGLKIKYVVVREEV